LAERKILNLEAAGSWPAGVTKMEMNMADNVNHPSHYNTGKIEVIDAIEDWGLNFSLGSVIKYVARAKHKGKELEDLRKAAFFVQREIARLEKKAGK
jgi:hypothetical protein